jgi:23S rRNA pseudouridine1911/1915/1917 synthase
MLKRGSINPSSVQISVSQEDLSGLDKRSTRADSFLHIILQQNPKTSHLSRSQIQTLIKSGKILKNKEQTKCAEIVLPNDQFSIEVSAPQALDVAPEKINVPVLFEDSHLVLVDKPKGMRVHPGGKIDSGTLVNALLYQIKNLSGIGGVLRPGIVHRLDKNTSGVMVVAKHDDSHQKLSSLFSKHDIDRRYWALCFGCPRLSQGRIETLIGRNPKDRKKMSANVTKGKKAITHYRVLERYGFSGKPAFASWIELKLETGRTHQVRVHMTQLGCSLFGDDLYGNPQSGQAKWKSLPSQVRTHVESLKGQTLHARLLAFTHPITQQILKFESAPPQDFIELQNKLRDYKC